MSNSPGLDLPYIVPGQVLKYITHNEAIKRLDRCVQMRVASFTLSTPPSDADRQDQALYWTNADPQGDWAGHPNKLCFYADGYWQAFDAQIGFLAINLPTLEIFRFDGETWLPLEAALPTSFEKLGIGTSADLSKRLSVASDGSLFTHKGSDHRLAINRQSLSDTASLLFQTDYAAAAEIGLTGTQDLQIKVSADGQILSPAMKISSVTGDMELGHPNHHTRLSVNGSASITKHHDAGETASPTVFDILASGEVGAPYTLSRQYSYGPVSWQGNISSTYRARGVDSAPDSVVSGDAIRTFNAYAHDGTGFRLAARLNIQADGAPKNGYAGCKFVFDLSDGETYPVFGGQGRVLEIRSDKSVHLNGPVLLSDILELASVLSADLPAPRVAGQLVFVSDADGGSVPAYSDGSEWRSLVDNAVIST